MHLSPTGYTNALSPGDSLHRAVFLIALASELRVSQIAALVRAPSLPQFSTGDLSVSLAPHPRLLTKMKEKDSVCLQHRYQAGTKAILPISSAQ